MVALSRYVSYKENGQKRCSFNFRQAMPCGWTRQTQGLDVEDAKLPNISKTSSPVYNLAAEIRHTVCQAVCRCRVMSRAVSVTLCAWANHLGPCSSLQHSSMYFSMILVWDQRSARYEKAGHNRAAGSNHDIHDPCQRLTKNIIG